MKSHTFELPIYTARDMKAVVANVEATWWPGDHGWRGEWEIEVLDYTAVLIDADGYETTTPTTLTAEEYDALLPRIIEEACVKASDLDMLAAREW